MPERKFYRTTFTFAVLSDEPIPDTMELDTILRETDDGAYLLDLSTDPMGVVEDLTPKQMADACYAASSDPSFFRLDDEGSEVDEDEEGEEALSLRDDGTEHSLTTAQALHLRDADLIYKCPECCEEGLIVFHITPERSWEDVNKEIKNV